MLIVGRLVLGFATGASYGLLPLYLTEISPTQYRGFNGSCQNLAISLNSLFSLLIAHPKLLGGKWLWLHIVGVPFAVLQMTLTLVFPETPKYLLLHKHDEIAARASLTFFTPDITDQQVLDAFTHFRSEELQAASYSTSLKDIFRHRHLRKPILISAAVMGASIFTGIVVVFSYSTSMFEQAGMGETAAEWCSIILSLFNVLGAVIATLLLERVGRRMLMLVGLIGCAVCDTLFMSINIAYDTLTHRGTVNQGTYNWIGILGVAVMIVHVTIYNVGPGAIQWFFGSEMTPQSIRSHGVMITLCVNNLSLMFLNFGYPPLEQWIGPYMFLIFIIPTVGFSVLLYYIMPETRNREIDEIIRQWRPERDTRKNFYVNSAFTLQRRR